MKAVIDFSLFQYKCISFSNGSEMFTYKTDSNQVKKIMKEFFEFLKQFTYSKNVRKDFPKNQYRYHPILDLEKIELIIKIFQEFGNYKEEYIEQYIRDNPNIWQIKINSERRMIFIQENKEGFLVIKPLFLDINHIIFNDKKIQKDFNICLVCWEKRCAKNF